MFNDTEATLDAECNYWGGTPQKAKFYGPIDYFPYLSSDPLSTIVELGLPESETIELPKTYSLSPNRPNPFNPTTTVSYDVPPPGGSVNLRIYNVSGQLVRILVSGTHVAGRYHATWDGRDQRGVKVASGVYFLDMEAASFHGTRKLVMLK